MPSRVFITQVPQRRGNNNVWVPVIDVTPAKEYGELITMLPPQASWLTQDDLNANLLRLLDEQRFCAEDYLMPLGSPAVMASAAILASRRLRNKPLQLLVWDRDTKRYHCHRVLT